MNRQPFENSSECVTRTLFGVDAKALDKLEDLLDTIDGDDDCALDGEEVLVPHSSDTDDDDDDTEDWADVFGFDTAGDNGQELDEAEGRDDHNSHTDAMGAPSPSAGFGMGPSSLSSADRSARQTSSMWAGLGVADGMGLREISQNAEENGYNIFLDEIQTIQDVYAENGAVELVYGAGEKQRSIIAIRVQVMPPSVLGDYNERMTVLANRSRGEHNRPNHIPNGFVGAKKPEKTTAKRKGATKRGGKTDGRPSNKKVLHHRCTSKGLFVSATFVKGYPDRPPLISVDPWHNLMSSDSVSSLNKKVVEIITNNIGAPVLMPTFMMIAQEAEALISQYEEGDIKEIAAEVRGVGIKTRLNSEAIHPDKYLGVTIADIIAKLPPGMEVECVENIMRTDLALSFEKMQRYLFNKNVKPYMKMKNIRNQQHILEQAQAVPSFHGTRMDCVGYIVRDGLLVPGTAAGVDVRCGSRFGVGIYSSPDPSFAAHYAQQIGRHYKLLVCATLLGKRDYSDDYEEIEANCDSRVADDGRQYVVFHRAQILPCYILHLNINFAAGMAKHKFSNLQRTKAAELLAIDNDASLGFFDANEIAKRRREVLTNLARKHLPFGFGPRGVHFVVEDIADVSDDDDYTGCIVKIEADNHSLEMYQHETVITNRYGTSHAHPQ